MLTSMQSLHLGCPIYFLHRVQNALDSAIGALQLVPLISIIHSCSRYFIFCIFFGCPHDHKRFDWVKSVFRGFLFPSEYRVHYRVFWSINDLTEDRVL